MWQLSRQQISRQKIGQQFYLKQNISCLKKKTGPGQLQTQDLRAPRHNSYLYAKLVENAKKLEYIMNQGRDESRRPDESSGQSC